MGSVDEGFDAEGELPERERPLVGQSAPATPLQVFRRRVFRPVDDPKVFPAPALDGGLEQSPVAPRDEIEGFHDHSLGAGSGELFPPGHTGVDIGGRCEIHQLVPRRDERRARSRVGQTGERSHVPEMVAIEVGATFGSEQVERGQFQIVERMHGPAVSAVRSHKALCERRALANTVTEFGEFRVLRCCLLESG